jgi:hypothetical protein
MKIRWILGLVTVSLIAFQARSFADTINGPPPSSPPVYTPPGSGTFGSATDFDFATFGGTAGGVADPTDLKYLHNFAVTLAGPLIMTLTQPGVAGFATFNASNTPTVIPSVGPPTFGGAANVGFNFGAAYDSNGTDGLVQIATITPTHSGTFSVTLVDETANLAPDGTPNGSPFLPNLLVGLGEAGYTGIVTATSTYLSGSTEYTTFTGLNANLGVPYQVYAEANPINSTEGLFSNISGLIFNFTPGSSTAVPEPSSIVALFGLGAMGLFFAARSRMSKAA